GLPATSGRTYPRHRLWPLPTRNTAGLWPRGYPLLAIPVSKVRSQTVRNLVHHGGGEIAFARRLGRLLRLHDLAGERQDDVIHPRVHKILEEDFLRAFRLMNTRIVGQIVCHRLVAVAQVASAEGRVHHLHGREVAAFGGTV